MSTNKRGAAQSSKTSVLQLHLPIDFIHVVCEHLCMCLSGTPSAITLVAGGWCRWRQRQACQRQVNEIAAGGWCWRQLPVCESCSSRRTTATTAVRATTVSNDMCRWTSDHATSMSHRQQEHCDPKKQHASSFACPNTPRTTAAASVEA